MRPINAIILHSIATPEGRKYTVHEVNKMHEARGWKGIGYHYLIHLNGTISKGRPVEEEGAHVKGRNHDTIGVAYVGGTDMFGNAKDTRTIRQKIAQQLLVNWLRLRYKVYRVLGHKDCGQTECPSYDVSIMPYNITALLIIIILLLWVTKGK